MIDEKLKEFKKETFWNGTLTGLFLEYIVMLVGSKLVVDMVYLEEELDTVDMIIGIAYGIALLIFPLFIFLLICRNKQKIIDGDPEFNEKFSILTEDIHLTRSQYGIYYLPINLVRKALFICIPIIIRHYLQVPALLVVQTFYIEWYGYNRPHI